MRGSERIRGVAVESCGVPIETDEFRFDTALGELGHHVVDFELEVVGRSLTTTFSFAGPVHDYLLDSIPD